MRNVLQEIAEVVERGKKDKLPALRKKKLLEETAKVDTVLSKYYKATVLQRLMNYSMQELLLLQID